MTYKEILKSAFIKAIRNGYEGIHLIEYANSIDGHLGDLAKFGLICTQDFAKSFWPNGAGITEYNDANPGFGFLLFGKWQGRCTSCGKEFKGKKQIEKIMFGHKGCPVGHEVWDSYLKEMVVSEDPIKYLEKYL